jgi:hypothetical protein
MVRRASVNQQVQLGAESTAGTPVAAGKSLRCFTWVLGPNADIAEYGATGRKYTQTTIENAEWVDISVDGPIDYNGVIYPLDSTMGDVSPSAHGASTTAKDWVFTPPVSGASTVKTYTIQQGESATRAHQVAYAFFTDFAYKGDRKSGLMFSGKGLAQPLSDGITLTNSPTAIALAPLAGKHLNIYLDSSSANLGVTQLTGVLNIDYSFGGIYGPFYPLNRANLGFTSPVDLKPKTMFKILMEADATGMARLTDMQNATTGFLRVDAQGLIIDNLQTVTIGGGATGGTFTLSYKGQTTTPITYSATLAATTVNTAFQALSTVSTNCTVTGSNGGPYTFTFSGGLANDMSPVVATNVSLSGGTPTITSVAQAYNKFTHDMAVKISKPNPFSDKDGVFAIEWDFTIVEDATWGKAQTFTITNLLTAL